MKRLGGPAGGAAAFALTAVLAVDEGGYNAVSYDRALLVLAAVAVVAVLAGRCETPGLPAAAMLGALGLLTAWTAASWLWSESPPRALVEAPRVALYAVAAAAVVLAGRRVPPVWIAGGVAAAATLVAIWNLVVIAHRHSADTGAVAEPIGYANGVALLCVLGLALLPMLPRAALLAALPLVVDLVKQASTGALAALGAAVLAYAFVTRPRLAAARRGCGRRGARTLAVRVPWPRPRAVLARRRARGERASGRRHRRRHVLQLVAARAPCAALDAGGALALSRDAR